VSLTAGLAKTRLFYNFNYYSDVVKELCNGLASFDTIAAYFDLPDQYGGDDVVDAPGNGPPSSRQDNLTAALFSRSSRGTGDPQPNLVAMMRR
jgi:hypothetical protein